MGVRRTRRILQQCIKSTRVYIKLFLLFLCKKTCVIEYLKIDKYHEFSSHFDEEVFQLFNIESALNSREATGAPSPKNMSKQIDAWKEKLVD